MKLTSSTVTLSDPLESSAQPRETSVHRKPVIAWVISGLLLIALLFILGLYTYIAWILARPHIEPLVSNPEQAIGVLYEDIQFSSRNETTTLQGWYLPGQDTRNTVVFSHGYGGNREEIWVPLYDLAHMLHGLRYNVLMFDYSYVQPAHDMVVTGGVREADELLGAVDYARQLGAEQTIVWGFSMGAGTALQAALTSSEIDAMILDSTFILEPDTLYYNLRQQISLPRYPTMALLRLLFPIVNGIHIEDIPYREVKETDYSMPILFIHGDQDERAPHSVIEGIARNQSHPGSSLWISPASTHELVYRANPETYRNRAVRFLQQVTSSLSP